jgi:hypothetical protein
MIGLDRYLQNEKSECGLQQHDITSLVNGSIFKSMDIAVGQENLTSQLPLPSNADAGFELETSSSLTMPSSPTTNMTKPPSGRDLLTDQCNPKHCIDQDGDVNASTADVSNEEYAVDCFFESLQLRSRFGSVPASGCKSDYYSRLFDQQPLPSSDDIDVYVPPKLAPGDGVLFYGQTRAFDMALDVCSSLTSLRFGSTAPEMFGYSDTEDLLSFACDDVNAYDQQCTDSEKFEINGEVRTSAEINGEVRTSAEKQLSFQASEPLRGKTRNPQLTASLPGKWRPAEKPMSRCYDYPEHSKIQPSTRERDEGPEDAEKTGSLCADYAVKYSDKDVYWNGSTRNANISKVIDDSSDRINFERTGESYENEGFGAERLVEVKNSMSRSLCGERDFNGKSTVGLQHSHSHFSLHCSVCKSDFRTKYSYVRHLKTPLHQRRVRGFCRRETSEDSSLTVSDVHLRSLILKQKPVQCRICRFYADSHMELVEHVSNDEHVKAAKRYSVTCVRCQYVADTSAEMLMHLTSAEHDSLVLSSSKCCILRKQRRCERSRAINERRIVLCEQCPATFRSNSSLTVHQRRRHTLERPYSCQTCCKSFADNSTLTLHKKTARHQKQLTKCT